MQGKVHGLTRIISAGLVFTGLMASNAQAIDPIPSGTVFYAGYTEKFLPIRDLISKGKIKEAYQAQEQLISQKKKGDLLLSLEQGTLALDASELEPSLAQFTQAEDLLGKRKKGSVVGGFLKKTAGTVAGMASGMEEMTPYKGESYERILMLNYKSIAFMLDGDRKAYNVARRSIDWQNKEKKAFDKNLAKVEKKLKKQQKKLAKKAKAEDAEKNDQTDGLKEKYTQKQALKVPSAYVNPFGFYVTGMVQEYDSYEDASLRDNARISYQKASDLNPNSGIIKKAVAAMKKPAPKNKRLLHVVVADGFAPEKKVLKYDFTYAHYSTSLKLPLYEPVPSKVARIEIKTKANKLLAKLDMVADIEAIALRHQMDSLPIQQLKATTAAVRTFFENKTLGQLGLVGNVLSKQRDKTANPDMRSWMTLPKAFYAARLYIPKSLSSIRIISYDSKGKVLAKKDVSLETKAHNFVYARTADKSIYSNSSKDMWVAMR